MDSPEFSDMDFSGSSEDADSSLGMGKSAGASPDASPGAKPSASPGAKPSASPGAKPSASPGAAPTAAKAPPVEPPPKFLSSIKPNKLDMDEMDNIREETDVQAMRNLLLRNYTKISGYDYLMNILCEIVKHYGRPELHFDKNTNCYFVISEVARIIDTLHKNWALFDIPLENHAVLKGSALKKMIDMSKDKLSQLLKTMDEKYLYFNEQISLLEMDKHDLMEHIKELEMRLEKANVFIQQLRGERFHEDLPSEQDFMEDMQMELSMREYLNSSLQEQNYKLRKSNEKYMEELLALQEERAEKYREHLNEIAELCKDMELEKGIRKEVVKKIEDITDNPDQIVEAVNAWMKTINKVIGEKQVEIRELNKKAKKLSDDIAMREVEITDLEDRNKEINKKVEGLRQETRTLSVEERFFSVALENQRKRNELLEREAASGSEVASAGLSPYVGPRAVERPRHWRPPRFNAARSKLMPLYEESSMEDSFHSPERHREDSPDYGKRQNMEDSPMSFEATSPESQSSPFSHSSPRSPHHDTFSPQSPYSPHYDTSSSRSPYSPHSDTRSTQSPYSLHSDASSPRSPGQTIAPGTQTYSRSPSEFAPNIRHIDPSTQPLGVTNRFDVGESFNMQTVHSGSPSPYTQETRVDRAIPEAGPSRMIESPFHVSHKTGITPDPYVTPFISKSRFGYTDPTAKVLNIPPGAEFDVPTGMRKTVVLTSPKRKEPLLVDIGIDPKPLTQTASGEHFVCDISLAVQQANKRRHIPDRVRFRHLSPVFTFDEPPAVTPTTDRRHGLHTPRGIFQRKHYNVRRVHKPHEYQSPNLPWSPHDLPDAGSPVSQLYPSPDITDTSISWAKGPDSPYSPLDRTFDAPSRPALNRTYEKSPSPVIKGRYYQRDTPESDIYSSPSPVIKGRYYQRDTPESDIYSSPSPMIKGRYYQRDTPESDFSNSPSPIIKGPSWKRRQQGQDRSSDRSQSPQLSRTYDMSSSGTKSFSPRSPSPGFDRTFDSHGEDFGHGQSFESHSSFDRPPSGTYDRSSSPQGNQTFSRSPSPRMNQTFNRSPSPRMNQTFNRSPPSQGNQTFSRTPSSQYDESLEDSSLFEEEYSPDFRSY